MQGRGVGSFDKVFGGHLHYGPRQVALLLRAVAHHHYLIHQLVLFFHNNLNLATPADGNLLLLVANVRGDQGPVFVRYCQRKVAVDVGDGAFGGVGLVKNVDPNERFGAVGDGASDLKILRLRPQGNAQPQEGDERGKMFHKVNGMLVNGKILRIAYHRDEEAE